MRVDKEERNLFEYLVNNYEDRYSADIELRRIYVEVYEKLWNKSPMCASLAVYYADMKHDMKPITSFFPVVLTIDD